MGNIKVKTAKANYRGKIIVRVINGYQIKGQKKGYATLTAATESLD